MHGEGFLFVNINMNDDGGYVQHAKTKELYWPMVVALLSHFSQIQTQTSDVLDPIAGR